MDEKYIIHFNTRIKATDRNRLLRENYCVPSNEVDSETKKIIKRAQEFFEQNNRYPMLISECYYTIPNDVFADNEHYTDKWVENHYRDCMENFDLNMKFFDSLEDAPFQKQGTRGRFCCPPFFTVIFLLIYFSLCVKIKEPNKTE